MGAHTGMYVLCVLYSTHAHMPVCPRALGALWSVKTMNKEDITQIVVAVLAAMAQPAEAATKAVVSVANKAAAKTDAYAPAGFRYLSKVKLPAAKKAGLAPAGMTVKQALAAGIMDTTLGEPNATKAPTATKTTVAQTAPTDKQLMRLTKAELVARLNA